METIYVIDDDASVRRSVARILRHSGYAERMFDSAESFLENLPDAFTDPACAVVDLQMPGLNGLELQRRINESPTACPVVFISGNGDIPASVQAMRQGAVTFLTKPFDEADLLAAVGEGLAKHRAALAVESLRRSVRERICLLTGRESEVMARVITGALNKQIAGQLGIAERTVKVHRARVMEKMGVVSVAELVRLCDAAGFRATQG